MGREKVIRKQGRCFVELPKEFINSDEVELFQLRDGYYLLSVQLPDSVPSSVSGVPKQETDDSKPTEEEISVLRKLQSIKFSNRTPEYVNRALTDPEKLLLKEMGRKKWVNIFKGRKYKNGVYNIADKVYPLLKTQNTIQETESREPKTGNQQPDTGNPNYTLLITQGYIIIRDQREAKALSEKLKSDMKSGSVLGVKGFDGSFYVVTKDYFSKASKSVLEALKEEADVQTITENTKLETDAVQAVLRHLAESGDIIEKKKGVYLAV